MGIHNVGAPFSEGLQKRGAWEVEELVIPRLIEVDDKLASTIRRLCALTGNLIR